MVQTWYTGALELICHALGTIAGKGGENVDGAAVADWLDRLSPQLSELRSRVAGRILYVELEVDDVLELVVHLVPDPRGGWTYCGPDWVGDWIPRSAADLSSLLARAHVELLGDGRFEGDGLIVDTARSTATIDGSLVVLTDAEASALARLLRCPRGAVAPDVSLIHALMRVDWCDRDLYGTICAIRHKLGRHAMRLRSIPNVGWAFATRSDRLSGVRGSSARLELEPRTHSARFGHHWAVVGLSAGECAWLLEVASRPVPLISQNELATRAPGMRGQMTYLDFVFGRDAPVLIRVTEADSPAMSHPDHADVPGVRLHRTCHRRIGPAGAGLRDAACAAGTTE